MNKILSFIIAFFTLFISFGSFAATPAFTGGLFQALSVCSNASATSINTLLSITDADAGNTETWSLVAGALHGTAAATYSVTSTGSLLTPTGLTYTPATGYSGNDSFKVKVNDGTSSDTITIRVTINPSPAVIAGPSALCVGAIITLSNAVSGGTWGSSSTNVAVSSVTGIVLGISAGTAAITYSLGSCLLVITDTINAAPNPGTISGPSSLCTGSSITLSDPITGGTWSNATGMTSISGDTVSGISGGIDTINYTVSNGCGTAVAIYSVTVIPTPFAGLILGPTGVCLGSTTTLSDTEPGGVWISSSAAATVTSSGVLTGVSLGTTTISYAISNMCGTDTSSQLITIDTIPFAGTITGGMVNICQGDTLSLTDTATGGIWGSTTGSTSVDASGLVTGMMAGIDTIDYIVTNGCGTAIATTTVRVKPMPNAGVITGPSAVCRGSTITLSDAHPGGIWHSSNTVSATINSVGRVAGLVPGTSVIRYLVHNDCGNDTAFLSLSVDMPVQPILGNSWICPLTPAVIVDPTPGGNWSSSNPLTVLAIGGFVFGITPGTATITYTVNNGCGTTTATLDVTVLASTDPRCDTSTTTHSNEYVNPLAKSIKDGLQIYPDPNNGIFTLNLIAGSNEDAIIVITNMVGEKIGTFKTATNKPTDIKLAVPQGIYFIDASTAKSRYTSKMIITQ